VETNWRWPYFEPHHYLKAARMTQGIYFLSTTTCAKSNAAPTGLSVATHQGDADAVFHHIEPPVTPAGFFVEPFPRSANTSLLGISGPSRNTQRRQAIILRSGGVVRQDLRRSALETAHQPQKN
jgi:hypothetical protein